MTLAYLLELFGSIRINGTHVLDATLERGSLRFGFLAIIKAIASKGNLERRVAITNDNVYPRINLNFSLPFSIRTSEMREVTDSKRSRASRDSLVACAILSWSERDCSFSLRDSCSKRVEPEKQHRTRNAGWPKAHLPYWPLPEQHGYAALNLASSREDADISCLRVDTIRSV